MNWFTGIVLFVIIWWTALFAVLPIGTRPVQQADDKKRLARRTGAATNTAENYRYHPGRCASLDRSVSC